ncbi:MAG: hypothetical protein O2985_01010 [Proteobacteria bacterium]|nr:hypothetical protein [Pseudomonadota bacterium]
MRGRQQPPVEEFSVVRHLAKEFARFLNRVQNDQVDILGSFLIENEWERYVDDGKDVVKSLEIAGFKIVPKEPTEKMVAAADSSLGSGLMGQRGATSYITQVFAAMIEEWAENHNPNLILDIISMALARASSPKSRRDTAMQDSSFQRFRKHSQDMLASLNKNGCIIAPDEPTGEMVAAGVAETAEIRTSTSQQIGADPAYLAKIYENMVAAVPE